MRTFRAVLIGTAVLGFALAPAVAGHIKPGLWKITTVRRFVGPEKYPAMVIGKMAANGVHFPSRPVTTTNMVCISPEDAAIDRLPRQDADNGSCDQMTFEATSDGYEGTTVCRGEFQGRVRFDVAFEGDAHYEGKTVFKGTTYTLPLETRTNFTGDWASADCNAPH